MNALIAHRLPSILSLGIILATGCSGASSRPATSPPVTARGGAADASRAIMAPTAEAVAALTRAVAIHVPAYDEKIQAKGLTSFPSAMTSARGIEFAHCAYGHQARAILQALAAQPVPTALLIYAADGPALRAWLFLQGGLRAEATLPLSVDDAEEHVSALRGALEVRTGQEPVAAPEDEERAVAVTPTLSAEAQAAARQMSLRQATAAVLPPEIARALPKEGRLVVLPVLELGTLPFAALRPFDDAPGVPLVERLAVAVAPSMLTLLDPAPLDEQGTGPGLRFERPLVVGDPATPPEAGFTRLKGAEKEASDVAAHFKATALLDEAATPARVLREAPEADLLYFATHGVSAARDPLWGSYLALAGKERNQAFLRAKDIIQQRWSAKLAVLSACDTGLGYGHAAGIIGLTRAFQLAGVPQTVMSSWKVDDQATGFQMTRFVEALDEQDPVDALRTATLAARTKYPDDRRWAAFSLFGVPRTLRRALHSHRPPPPPPGDFSLRLVPPGSGAAGDQRLEVRGAVAEEEQILGIYALREDGRERRLFVGPFTPSEDGRHQIAPPRGRPDGPERLLLLAGPRAHEEVIRLPHRWLEEMGSVDMVARWARCVPGVHAATAAVPAPGAGGVGQGR